MFPTSALFSSAVGTRGSLSPTNIGVAAEAGATETLPIPLTDVEESGEPAIARPSA